MIGKILSVEIKNRNQVLRRLLLLLVIMYAVVTMVLITEESMLQHELLKKYDRYGEWTAVILDGNEELADLLAEAYPEVKFGKIAIIGEVLYNEENGFYKKYSDQ